MRNLSKTVDRILKIEPTLEAHLIPIKSKWDRGPRKMVYWKQLFKVLNTEIPVEHPKRFEIQSLFTNKNKKTIKKLNTFEVPSPLETVVGVIPEHLEGRLRRTDRLQIELAKRVTEAKMTHNENMMIEVNKQGEKLDIEQRKIWLDVKNYFNIWNVKIPTSYFIRYKDNLLVLTSIKLNNPPAHPGLPTEGIPDSSYIIKMDPETLKRLFRYLNTNPPPDFPSES
jgi:hypothetical protein